MNRMIFLLSAIARESVARENDAVFIVCQNVLYILLKRTARSRHSLLGKLIKTLLATIRASDCSLSRNVEVPILQTRTEIAVQIPARECSVRFSNDRFCWMRHDASGHRVRIAPLREQYATGLKSLIVAHGSRACANTFSKLGLTGK
jgi:hypothetical protein